jgi:hypothetical protein
MRFALLLLLALAGCGRAGLPSGGDMSGGGGGGGAARDCTAACNRCQNGPCCGAACCNKGEYCDPVTVTCKCGDGVACTGGNFCASGALAGPNQCGRICCGVTMVCPG